MSELQQKYSTTYDEKSIADAYHENINSRIISSSLYSASFYILFGGGYFIFSDIVIREIPHIIPWRIPSVALAASMLILRRSSFTTNLKGMFIVYNAMLFSICFMISGITWTLAFTDLFKSSINGILVAIFAVYVGTYGGFKVLILNFSPILFMTLLFYLTFDPPREMMVEFGNVLGLMVACLSISQIQENLRFREFRFRKISEEEQKRSNSLLLNILPEETATELKATGSVEARKFESATVLFTDFKQFTSIAEKIKPEVLVKSIDFYFRAFDAIIEKYDLEKIKTIGDSYMCVGGIPTASTDHAEKVVCAALDIAEFVEHGDHVANPDIQRFEIRIGIHTGPVVAGVVGSKKFQYDVWGDTVNIASRMESASESGRINISEATFRLVQHQFTCTYRGNLEVKNHGKLAMYFAEK